MNISSVIIKINGDIQSIKSKVGSIKDVDIHLEDKDKAVIIATICADDVSKEIAIVKELEKIDGVVEVMMHYAYAEDELNAERAKLDEKKSGNIADFLNDDSIPLESIKYGGDVNNLLKSK